MTLKKLTPFLAAMSLVACSGDSSSSVILVDDGSEKDVVVETFDDLNVCTDTREGAVAYVKDKKIAYTCKDGGWVAENSSSSEEGDSGSSAGMTSSSEKKTSSSSSEKKESSSSSEKKESSSSSETPKSSSSEEASSSSDALPRKIANIEVRVYQYDYAGLDFLRLTLVNNEDHDLDSLTLRLFFTAKPEEVEKCATLIDSDICQMYDAEGFNAPCENDRELRDLLRHALPVRVDNSYDSIAGTYTYYFPVPLGSTTLKPKSKLLMDYSFSSGISNDNYMTCETLRTTAKKRFSKDSSDWSWMPHTKAEDGADYAGMPLEDRDFGVAGEEIPLNPYIFVYRNDLKDGFLWGYSPIDELIGL